MIILTPKKAGEESEEEIEDIDFHESEEVGPEEEVNLDDLDLGDLDSASEESK
jgi:hypothetical protein